MRRPTIHSSGNYQEVEALRLAARLVFLLGFLVVDDTQYTGTTYLRTTEHPPFYSLFFVFWINKKSHFRTYTDIVPWSKVPWQWKIHISKNTPGSTNIARHGKKHLPHMFPEKKSHIQIWGGRKLFSMPLLAMLVDPGVYEMYSKYIDPNALCKQRWLQASKDPGSNISKRSPEKSPNICSNSRYTVYINQNINILFTVLNSSITSNNWLENI